jgi:hypothetical protein
MYTEKKSVLSVQKQYNPHIKGYYIRYCNILSKVIKEAKKRHYDNEIKYYTNKNKTTWNIVNKETHRKALVQTINY